MIIFIIGLIIGASMGYMICGLLTSNRIIEEQFYNQDKKH